MANALGIKGILGVGKETTWKTPVTVTDRVPFLSESIEKDNEDILHNYLQGTPGYPAMQRNFEPVIGSIEAVLPYTEKSGSEFVSTDLLIALAMGATSWDAANTVNQITLLDDLNVFGTLAVPKWKTDDVWEFISCYVRSMTITLTSGEFMKANFDIMAYDLDRSSTTNQVSDLTTLGPADVPNIILMSHTEFKVGNQAGALVDADRYDINSLTITLNNNITDPQQTSKSNTVTDPTKTIEPVRNGFRDVTVEAVLPRYAADTFLDHWDNEDDLQMQIDCNDPNTSNYKKFFMPYLKLEKVSAPVAGPEAIQQTLSFRCLRRNSASDLTFADSSTDGGEIWVETKDERTASIL